MASGQNTGIIEKRKKVTKEFWLACCEFEVHVYNPMQGQRKPHGIIAIGPDIDFNVNSNNRNSVTFLA